MYKNKKIGLALSGGGYRAAAFHIGTLRAMRKLGVLDNVDVISSVSGGSITAAYYALHKEADYENHLIKKLQHGVMTYAWLYFVFILLVICGAVYYLYSCFGLLGLLVIIPISAMLFFAWYYIFPLSTIIEHRYRRAFFGNNRLSDLPKSPTISINATDLATSNQFYFSQHYVGSFRYGYDSFNASEFPVSKAVMASSCVPFGFSPIRIPKKFITSVFNHKERPLLFDGGLYDNQGTHCLTDSYSRSGCDLIIASVAGNTSISNRFTLNPFLALWKTSNVLMTRIKNIQVQENIYKRIYPDKHFAYIDLSWDCTERILDGFIDALLRDNINVDVIACHNIQTSQIQRLKNSDTTDDARNEIKQLLKQNVKWDELESLRPNASEHSISFSVATNLTGLSVTQINSLVKQSEWMTYIQIRLYLPMIL